MESDPYLTTHHLMVLNGSGAGACKISVASQDAAGNLTGDDNGGNYYQVAVLMAAPPMMSAPRMRDVSREIAEIAPDMEATIDDIFAEEDKVVVRWTFRGTFTGKSLRGEPPTGEKFIAVANSIYRFANGKIVEDWGFSARYQTATPWE